MMARLQYLVLEFCCLPRTAENVADMILPAAEIARSVPEAVRVFGEGPKTLKRLLVEAASIGRVEVPW